MTTKYPLKQGFLPNSISDRFQMDHALVAKWLEENGHTVVRHYDTGRNGLAITDEGWNVSTNGYCYPSVSA